MSRFQLSQAVNFTVREKQILRFERGRQVPNVEDAIALCQALKIKLKDLTDAPG